MNDESIFVDALELADPSERVEFVRQACAGDERLRAQVESLLQAHESAGQFMSQPALNLPDGGPDGSQLAESLAGQMSEKPGDQIGPYHLIEVIGEGGMGVIFRAQQNEPVRREVALKIIKPGLETKQLLARFHRECQALAVMDHAFIAKVFDAGVTAAGRPYFTMELVHGAAITDFCTRNQLDLGERLKLFLDVCDAIQHAHRRGVIHRDIKPSNILVIQPGPGAPGTPKVVDFGVAKALTPEPGLTETVTRVGQVMGTPQYMSPEQADLSGDRVDTRTDVYSLGVILYELLTGTTPIDAERLRKTRLSEVFRAIRESDPRTPSRRMQATTLSGGSPAAGTLPGVQVSKVRGELDWIVMKALEKDPQRRYQTPLDLADDIQRYLAGLPVEAGPPSLAYRLRKLAGRHRAALAVSAALLIVVVAASVVSAWQAVVANQARQAAKVDAERAHDAEQLALERLEETKAQERAAEQARRQAETIKQYVVEAFSSPNPFRGGADVTVFEVLEKSVARIEQDFPDDPTTRAELLSTFANTYAGLGKYQRAVELFGRSLTLCEQVHGPDARQTMRTLADVGHVRALSNDGVGRSIEELERAATTLEQKHPSSHKDLAYARRGLAQAYTTAGRVSEAESLARDVRDQHIRFFGEDAIDTAEAENTLAHALYERGKRGPAAELWERVVARFRREFGDQNPRAQRVTMNLASCYLSIGREQECVTMLEELLPVNCAIFGPEHPTTIKTMQNLAAAYAKLNQLDKAVELGDEALQLHRKVHGPSHLHTMEAMTNLGRMHMEAGRHDQALALLSEAADLTRQSAGAEHPQVADTLNLLSELHVRRKAFDAAIEAAEESLRIRLKVLGPDHPDTLLAQYALARAYNQSGRVAEAAAVSGPALEKWLEHFGDADPRTLAARRHPTASR